MIAFNDLDKIVSKWVDMNESIIKPTLHRRAHGPNYWYRLQLVEEHDDDIRLATPAKLDNCVRWTEDKLKEWPDCNRKAWDIWDFKHRKDAEKFITMFYLRWAQ